MATVAEGVSPEHLEVQFVVRSFKPTTTDSHIHLLSGVPGDFAEHGLLFPVGGITRIPVSVGIRHDVGQGSRIGSTDPISAASPHIVRREARARCTIGNKRIGHRVLERKTVIRHPDRIPAIFRVLIVQACQPVEGLTLVREPELLRKPLLPFRSRAKAGKIRYLGKVSGRVRHRDDAVQGIINRPSGRLVFPVPIIGLAKRTVIGAVIIRGVVLVVQRIVDLVRTLVLVETRRRHKLGEFKISLDRQRRHFPLRV